MPAERKTRDFGARLREARERKGVSLRDIAERTKISVRALEALEQDDIARLPGGIFSRGFVRSYAAQVGLDPEAAVEDFVRGFPEDAVTAGHPSVASIDEDAVHSDRRMATVVLRLVAISVPLAVLVLYFGLRERAPIKPPSGSLVAQAAASASSPRDAQVDRAQVDRLSVEITASNVCVVSATIDAQPSFDLHLQAGSRQSLDVGSALLLTVSDPSAIEWTINGTPGRSLGPSGVVATVQVTLGNYRDYLVAR